MTVSGSLSAESLPKPVVKVADMPPEMLDGAVGFCQQAVLLHNSDQQIAEYVKRSMENKFKKFWHVAVGSNMCAYATHEKGCYAYFYIELFSKQWRESVVKRMGSARTKCEKYAVLRFVQKSLEAMTTKGDNEKSQTSTSKKGHKDNSSVPNWSDFWKAMASALYNYEAKGTYANAVPRVVMAANALAVATGSVPEYVLRFCATMAKAYKTLDKHRVNKYTWLTRMVSAEFISTVMKSKDDNPRLADGDKSSRMAAQELMREEYLAALCEVMLTHSVEFFSVFVDVFLDEARQIKKSSTLKSKSKDSVSKASSSSFGFDFLEALLVACVSSDATVSHLTSSPSLSLLVASTFKSLASKSGVKLMMSIAAKDDLAQSIPFAIHRGLTKE